MKPRLTPAVVSTLVGVALSSHAAVLLDFDGIPAGTPANLAAPPGSTFAHAVLTPDLDPAGDPIPGSDVWRPDPAAPAVLAENPSLYGRGDAPSPNNALNALWQPVLLSFGTPVELVSFSVTLDNDVLGSNGLRPGFEDIAVLFLDPAGEILAALRIDQTTPGYQAARGPLSRVGGIVFPGGAFYDELALSITPIPEVSATPLLAALGALGVGLTRRRRC